jgi:hypothetical protein
MEHLFSPCTRLNDLFEYEDHFGELEEGNACEEFENVNELNLDVSIQELLSAGRGLSIRGYVRDARK